MNGAYPKNLFNSTAPVTFFKDNDFAPWQYPYVNIALQNYFVSGGYCLGSTTDRCFFPNAPITRSEAVKILVNVFDLMQVGPKMDFSDASSSDYPLISVAASNKGKSGCKKSKDNEPEEPEPIVSGFGDSTFKPTMHITRDQAAKIIAVALSFKKP